MLRALVGDVVEGIPTTIPAQVAILSHDDVVSASHSTRWVEERLDLSGIMAGRRQGVLAPVPAAPAVTEAEPAGRVLREVDAEVDGRRYRVRLWVPETGGAGEAGRPATAGPHRWRARGLGREGRLPPARLGEPRHRR